MYFLYNKIKDDEKRIKVQQLNVAELLFFIFSNSPQTIFNSCFSKLSV